MYILLPSNAVLQRAIIIVLALALLFTIVLGIFVYPVEAATVCTPWRNEVGRCCDSWMPGLQQVQYRFCQFCSMPRQCNVWTEYRCHNWSWCGW